MTADSAMMNGSTTEHRCKGDDQGCLKAMACCQTPTNILAPTGLDWLPAEWHEIVYPGTLEILVGLHLKPELHPPTILA